MFDALGQRLEKVFKGLRNRGRLSPKDLDEALREIRIALLEADVALPAADVFLDRVRTEAVGAELLRSVTPGQQVVKVVHDELVVLLGSSEAPLVFASKPPTVIMLAGLQGSGKTSTAAKLGALLKKQGKNPLLVAADLARPAAVEQLQTLGRQAGIEVFADTSGRSAPEVASLGVASAQGSDVVIVDTAGRLHVDREMMDELVDVHRRVEPHEVLFVLDAMVGQDALTSAKSFSEAVPISGIVLTKIDGDARGGAALSAVVVTDKPVKFAGTGEKLADLEIFHPDRIASRILGMGDVLTLVEKAEETISAEKAEEQARKIVEEQFTLEDFLDQMQQVKKMGGLGDLVKMLPGVPGIPGMGKLSDLQVDDGEMVKAEAVIKSMTPNERNDPKVIDGSRRTRIANGSGTSVSDVNGLIRQFDQARKMMKQMVGGGLGIDGKASHKPKKVRSSGPPAPRPKRRKKKKKKKR